VQLPRVAGEASRGTSGGRYGGAETPSQAPRFNPLPKSTGAFVSAATNSRSVVLDVARLTETAHVSLLVGTDAQQASSDPGAARAGVEVEDVGLDLTFLVGVRRRFPVLVQIGGL